MPNSPNGAPLSPDHGRQHGQTQPRSSAGAFHCGGVASKALPTPPLKQCDGQVRLPKNRHEMIFLLPRNRGPSFEFITHKQPGAPTHRQPGQNEINPDDLTSFGGTPSQKRSGFFFYPVVLDDRP
jgi:hypothetical protein